MLQQHYSYDDNEHIGRKDKQKEQARQQQQQKYARLTNDRQTRLWSSSFVSGKSVSQYIHKQKVLGKNS